MGRALAVLIWIMTVASVVMFVNPRWWFPPGITEHAPAYDRQFIITIVVVGIAFVTSQLALGYAVWRFRDTGDGSRAVYSHGNNRLEMIWTAITAVIFIGVAVLGQQVWANLHFQAAPAGANKVRVVAQQFQWNFHYAGTDNTFGRTDPQKIDDSALNFIGLDDTDAAAKDDVVVPLLITQVDRPVELTMRGRDVTHSIWVPELRFKQDLVPGLDITVHFTPQKVGRYELACTELCGQLHYKMKSYLLVLPAEQFNELMAMPQARFQSRVSELSREYPLPKY
ncbi:MAG TPA: cytochrome c oxidase subunit II [Pyrinomonadaceae bacterium]|nr:cytochrome c oxidase subunit II [Pyrinomonadaceae bacterium]